MLLLNSQWLFKENTLILTIRVILFLNFNQEKKKFGDTERKGNNNFILYQATAEAYFTILNNI